VLAIRALRAVDRALLALETAAVTIALLAMVGLAFAEVVLQNAHIDALPPSPWLSIVARQLVLWVGMLGASLAAAERRHISIEVIAKAVTPSGRRVVEGLVDLATIFVCALLSYVAWRYIVVLEQPDKRVLGTVLGVKVMAWWSSMVMPVGFGLVAFRYFRLLVERIFVDTPITDERAEEVEEYDRKHPSGEREAAP
jgi:TRAP-type C4-dicarboxylate transport system permease small subunit